MDKLSEELSELEFKPRPKARPRPGGLTTSPRVIQGPRATSQATPEAVAPLAPPASDEKKPQPGTGYLPVAPAYGFTCLPPGVAPAPALLPESHQSLLLSLVALLGVCLDEAADSSMPQQGGQGGLSNAELIKSENFGVLLKQVCAWVAWSFTW